MENAILKNTTCFTKTDHAKFLKIKIKIFTDTLKSRMICHGLNFSKKPYYHTHQYAKNLKKLTQISKNIECTGAFT